MRNIIIILSLILVVILNHSLTAQISWPDLVVTSVEVIDGDGPDITYRYTVKNQGSGLAKGSRVDKIYLSVDEVIDSSDYLIDQYTSSADDTIGLGETHSVRLGTSILRFMPLGDYYLGVHTNADEDIFEINKTNNTGYDTSPKVRILLPDVAVSNVSVLRVDGWTVSFQATISNRGNLETGVTVHWYLSKYIRIGEDWRDILIKTTYHTLGPGETQNYSDQFNIKDSWDEGQYYLGGVADKFNDIRESDESNNVSYDLDPRVEVVRPSYEVTYPNGGEIWVKGNAYTVTWNQTGDYPLVVISILKDDTTLLNYTSDNSQSLTWGAAYLANLPDGDDYRVKIQTFRGSVYDISDQPFTIQTAEVNTPTPDLTLPEISLTDSIGPELVYTFLVRNEGDDDAVGPFHLYAYLSPDQKMSAESDYLIQDIVFAGDLTPGKKAWIPRTPGVTVSEVPPGSYYLWGLVDAEGQVSEQNERNNLRRFTGSRVTIPGPGSESVPEIPQPLSPANDAYNVSLEPELNWQRGGSTPVTHYEVRLNDQWGVYIYSANDLTEPSTAVGTLRPGRDYFWRVRAGNAQGWSEYSNPSWFTVSGTKRYWAGSIGENPGIAPVVDGVLDDEVWSIDSYYWETLPWGGQPGGWNRRWSDAADCTVMWKALWCKGNHTLYVAARIRDDVAGASDHDVENIWQDDCIEFYTDGDASGGSLTGGYGNAQQWQVRRDNMVHLLHESAAFNGKGCITATKAGEDGNWTVEAAFKIYNQYPDQLKEPEPGDVMGWEVWYNDSDNENMVGGLYSRDHQLGWRYNGTAYLNADYFQELEFGNAFQGYEGYIRNSRFHFDTKHWFLFVHSDATADVNVTGGEAVTNISKGGGNAWSVQLQQTHLHIEQGFRYSVSFDAYAALARTIDVRMSMNASLYTVYGERTELELTPTKTRYSFSFQMAHTTDPAGRLTFDLGLSDVNVMIDNVVVKVEKGQTTAVSREKSLPGTFDLKQNYPNPFNDETQIEYECRVSCKVNAVIYDIKGRKIRVLEMGRKSAGHHRLIWNGTDLGGNPVASGVYLLVIRAGKEKKWVRMVLLR